MFSMRLVGCTPPLCQVDTTQPFTVRTQFVTADGTDNGALSEIRRTYVQNGKTIENSQVVRNVGPLQIYFYENVFDYDIIGSPSVFTLDSFIRYSAVCCIVCLSFLSTAGPAGGHDEQVQFHH
jgi:hypothetical protein